MQPAVQTAPAINETDAVQALLTHVRKGKPRTRFTEKEVSEIVDLVSTQRRWEVVAHSHTKAGINAKISKLDQDSCLETDPDEFRQRVLDIQSGAAVAVAAEKAATRIASMSGHKALGIVRAALAREEVAHTEYMAEVKRLARHLPAELNCSPVTDAAMNRCHVFKQAVDSVDRLTTNGMVVPSIVAFMNLLPGEMPDQLRTAIQALDAAATPAVPGSPADTLAEEVDNGDDSDGVEEVAGGPVQSPIPPAAPARPARPTRRVVTVERAEDRPAKDKLPLAGLGDGGDLAG